MSNLELWEKVEKTNPNFTKKAKIGQLDITAINATSQIKEATRQWGKYGDTWGLRDLKYEYMDINETRLALLSCKFYYPNGEFEIHTSIKVSYKTAQGYLKIDDDFMKKAETDVTTKALSKLGFNADVFMGLYDDNRYVQNLREERKSKSKKQKYAEFLNHLSSRQIKEDDFNEYLKASNLELKDIIDKFLEVADFRELHLSNCVDFLANKSNEGV